MSTLAYTPCQCGCRPAEATEPGCACKECQPGQGIDHLREAGQNEKARRTRLMRLLRMDTLAPADAEELDNLLTWHVHGGM